MTEKNSPTPAEVAADAAKVIQRYIVGSDAVRDMIEADHPTLITQDVRALANRHRPLPLRTWTRAGATFTTPDRRPDVLRAISTLRWQNLAACCGLSAYQASAIQIGVRDLGLPNVSALALTGLHSTVQWQHATYSIYGIQAHYLNGRSRLYVLDRGTTLVPLASDFWPRHLRGATASVRDAA